MRPAETYRGARRNKWRAHPGLPDSPGRDWRTYTLAGDNWTKPFDYEQIKLRLHTTQSWDYSNKQGFIYQKVKPVWAKVKTALRARKRAAI